MTFDCNDKKQDITANYHYERLVLNYSNFLFIASNVIFDSL